VPKPDHIKASESSIPWRQIADIGNVLRHGYEHVDPATLWALLAKDLPLLRDAIDRLLSQYPDMD
jgi:uncharacterized protein with HEPN domain